MDFSTEIAKPLGRTNLALLKTKNDFILLAIQIFLPNFTPYK